MNRFEYKIYNTAMETEVQLTRALEDAERLRKYVRDLIEESDAWMSKYRDARTEAERLKLECSALKIWEISHNEQRQKFVKFLKHVESYPVQYTPGLRAEIENMINYFSK